ncbi:MAG: 16S rRNA (cytosine(1402)-N(4))-methyltransferase RsmH [Planctomycetes bacterium]|nr:16S rRNA (cytosine(1402)-N(4))-methyltransferase RsmH [Planctomycetota bacterium]
MSDRVHTPVMVEECLSALLVAEEGLYLDLTTGAGGHAEAALSRAPRARWLGVDRDAEILEIARANLARFGERVELVQARWGDLDRLLDERGIAAIDGALLDLGVSSLQLDRAERGFAFSQDGPLDMRLDPRGGEATAAELLERATQEQIATWIRSYGEERFAGRIARVIVEARRRQPLRRTGELARLIEEVVPAPPRGQRRRIHPATRTFQALRIAVNRELEDLECVLGILRRRLAPGGRLVVLSYHSLEDRIVKRFLRDTERADEFHRVSKKPLRPSEEEIRSNSRSRSAKLRIGERARPTEVGAARKRPR